ncbi:MAG: septum formation protein Maf [Caldilineaceae bacterium]|nr:septum formation protein Maf [Caldilineaceae bacterium]
MRSPQLILASGSPRRQQFLRELGLDFVVQVADIDETPDVAEAPLALAYRLATTKARAVAARLAPTHAPAVIIAADTVVALGDQQLGKPGDDAEATHMLTLLRDCTHEVHTGLSLLAWPAGTQETVINTTQVQMRNYTDAEIAAYIATGDPFDKAGAYAVQHPTFAPVCALQGCISGVIGLPLADLRRLLAAAGVEIPHALGPVCQRQTQFLCCQDSAALPVALQA